MLVEFVICFYLLFFLLLCAEVFCGIYTASQIQKDRDSEIVESFSETIQPHMSEESRRIYNLLSSSFIGNNSRISDQEMESLRSDYLKLIEENDWMEQLLLISHNLKESIREKMFLV